MDLSRIPPDRPVLIAGCTGSGKSGLALRIAQDAGGVIVNADAMQVYAGMRVLTARPGPEEEARAPHALYGHVPFTARHSTGDWLREAAQLVGGRARPIFVGGSGLLFDALTRGLAAIPATPAPVRARGDAMALDEMLAALDPVTSARIDTANRARVQRAWEVAEATGRGLAAWQDDTPAPALPLSQATALVVERPLPELLSRLEDRLDAMLAGGAVAEVAALRPVWDPTLPAARAIGAAEILGHLEGRWPLEEARARILVATRAYAKRQRTWMRNRMRGWTRIAAG
ncbi:MAG: tRNA (adenosine(37)-N6)-dimethylallyltransferase MiaA [Paracoccaceae bacterium]